MDQPAATPTGKPLLDHESLLRCAFDLARRARSQGEHPFGALLAGPDGTVLMEQCNGFTSEGQDHDGACRASAREPRIARLWRGVSRELHDLFVGGALRNVRWRDLLGRHRPHRLRPSRKNLKATTGAHAENPTLDLPCRTVFAAGQRPVEVIGPLLEDEAAALQADFWNELPVTAHRG